MTVAARAFRNMERIIFKDKMFLKIPGIFDS
jgi:hypothetical protein